MEEISLAPPPVSIVISVASNESNENLLLRLLYIFFEVTSQLLKGKEIPLAR